MTLHIPDRNPHIWGYIDPRHTLQGVSISARTGLAYGEIAVGTSGRQKTWHPCALYRPPLTDRAYHQPGDGDHFLGKWDIVGIIKPTRNGNFVLWAHRWFNPAPNYHAEVRMSSQSDLRVIMETMLEKWYG